MPKIYEKEFHNPSDLNKDLSRILGAVEKAGYGIIQDERLTMIVNYSVEKISLLCCSHTAAITAVLDNRGPKWKGSIKLVLMETET